MKFCIARERMIGWYHTGPKLRASDQEINDLFIARRVMFIVNVQPHVVGMSTDGHLSIEEIKDVWTIFQKIQKLDLIFAMFE